MTSGSTDQHILIVDHDEPTAVAFAHSLRLEGYEVRTALSVEDGWREIASRRPDAILVEFRIPGIGGLEFLRRLRVRDDTRRTPAAIVSGDYFIEDGVAADVRELGARLVFKPLWLEDLTSLVRGLLASDPVDHDRGPD